MLGFRWGNSSRIEFDFLKNQKKNPEKSYPLFSVSTTSIKEVADLKNKIKNLEEAYLFFLP